MGARVPGERAEVLPALGEQELRAEHPAGNQPWTGQTSSLPRQAHDLAEETHVETQMTTSPSHSHGSQGSEGEAQGAMIACGAAVTKKGFPGEVTVKQSPPDLSGTWP